MKKKAVEKPSIPDVLSGKHIRDRLLTLTNQHSVGQQDRFFGMFAFYLSYIPIVNLTLGYAFAYMHKALTVSSQSSAAHQSSDPRPIQKTMNFILTELICGVVSATMSPFFTRLRYGEKDNWELRPMQLGLGSALLIGLASAVIAGSGGAAIGVFAGLAALGWASGMVAVAIQRKLTEKDLIKMRENYRTDNLIEQNIKEADEQYVTDVKTYIESMSLNGGGWRNPWRAFF